MDSIAKLSDNERKELFQATAYKMGIQETIIEKDFWVCFLLNHLFHDSIYKDYFVFKGGTSLSKAYNVIKRFSEDIDLILDWTRLNYKPEEPWEERSKNQQDKFNKEMNRLASEFYSEKLIPELNKEIENKIGKAGLFVLHENDPMIVKFEYPVLFPDSNDYLRSYVQLEIGPIAEWLPSHNAKIKSFCAEYYPNLFVQSETEVRTVDVERTFWEKITILHKICNWPENKPLQKRYARHIYDVYQMYNSNVKNLAFSKKELLQKDVTFKEKFYYSKNANYENATLENIQLVPNGRILDELANDYEETKKMIYGEKPDFESIIKAMKNLEKELRAL